MGDDYFIGEWLGAVCVATLKNMEINKIYCGNCENVLRTFDSESVDMILTSPPYDNLRAYQGYEFNFHAIAQALYRVLKKNGVMVWVVSDATIKGSESTTAFHQAIYFNEIGLNLHDTMIYQKINPPPVGGHNRYYQSFEYMFVFSKGTPKTFNPIFTQRTNKHNDKRTKRVKSFTRNRDGIFIKKAVTINETVKLKNVWSYVVGGGNSVEVGLKHPAAFPQQLAEDHIKSWSNKGDIVLDPMCGSGTTLLAAKKLERHYIGIDICREYCELSESRLRKKEESIS